MGSIITNVIGIKTLSHCSLCTVQTLNLVLNVKNTVMTLTISEYFTFTSVQHAGYVLQFLSLISYMLPIELYRDTGFCMFWWISYRTVFDRHACMCNYMNRKPIKHKYIARQPCVQTTCAYVIIIICPIGIAYSYGTDNKIGLRLFVCLSVCLCVCPCVITLTVAFLCRFSPKLTQRCKPPNVRTSSLGVNIVPLRPLFYPQKLPFLVQRSWKSMLRSRLQYWMPRWKPHLHMHRK